MTESHRENLSAGIDGELSTEELRFLLRRLDHDASLLAAWSRYHVAREGLRRERPALASAGFASRVMFAIDTEVAVPLALSSARGAEGRRRSWLRWSAGGAIAAGVAVAALMVAQPTADNDVRGGAAQTASAPARNEPVQQLASVSLQRPQAASAAAPAVVPPWLSANGASQLSERASLTLGAGDTMRPYRVRGYRTLNTGGGSYLLLIDPSSRAANNGNVPQQAVVPPAATAQ